MTDDTANLAGIKCLLDKLINKYKSNDKIIIDRQKRIDNVLNNIRIALIDDCAQHGVHKEFIQSRLKMFQSAGEIYAWSIIPGRDCTLEECFIVRVSFGPSISTTYDIQIDYHDHA